MKSEHPGRTKLGTRRLRSLGGFWIVLVLALVAQGCSNKTSTVTGGPTGNAACDVKGAAPGVSSSEIKVGADLATTGFAALVGKGEVEGEQLAFDNLNSQGGIKGKKIKLIYYDDGFDPAKAIQNIRRLTEQDKVLVLSGGSGTTPHLAAAPLIHQKGIPAIGTYAPATGMGTMKFPDFYTIWPNYDTEFKVLTQYALDNLGSKTFAAMWLTGDVGKSMLDGVRAVLQPKGLDYKTTVEVQGDITDLSAVAQQLKASGADTVTMLHGPSILGDALAAIHRIGYKPQVLVQSDADDAQWLETYKADNEGVLLATTNLPLDSTNPLIQAYVQGIQTKYGHVPTIWDTRGYVAAQITIQALKTAPALTRSCVIYALQHMTNFDLGLLPPISFGPQIRQGILGAGVKRVENGKFVTLKPFVEIPQG
jgi:branched-chain amino acid transport system substrate-binding protein